MHKEDNMSKKCAIFGHRKIDKEDKLYLEDRLHETFKTLIDKGYSIFLFGSKSEFDDLCYKTITNLKDLYTDIKRIGYLYAMENAFTKEEYDNYQLLYKGANNRLKNYKLYEKIKHFEFENSNLYIERNKKMIDDADICIFYYKENHLSPKNSLGNRTNSGTKIALEYAKSKNKEIIIVNI